ncbi:MAG TPA: MOSC N-terminal beta barrel domain-containing protein [Pyrinomonadaceae bacterium]|nr:MOSC N-terminal beta barrel domain-containing protein [Pyrinomonadaceae bacterium]
MRIGTVKQIWRYAVKSMAGEQLESCTVDKLGIRADRGWALRDETTGRLATGSRFPVLMQCEARYREQPGNGSIPHVVMCLPNGVELASDTADVNARLSELLDRSVSLWSLQPAYAPHVTHFDAFPIHVLTTSSIETMRRLNPAALWDVRRFRPNFLIETDAGIEGLIEFGWSSVRLGSVELKCEMPTERCVMATNAQKEIPKDPGILRSLVEAADQNLGMYASVVKAGEVRVGDVVEVD